MPADPSTPRRRLSSLWIRPLPQTLDRYIIRRFGGIFLADTFLFVLVYVLIDSLSQVDELAKNSAGFADFLKIAWLYYYYHVPSLFCLILGPVITMASAAFTATVTVRTNELVPILASGISLQRLFLPVILLSAAVSAGTLALQEAWIPAHREEILASKAYGKGGGAIRNALYTDRAQDVVVIAEKYYPIERRGERVLVLGKEKEGGRRYLLHAASMRWVAAPGERGFWRLENGGYQVYDAAGLIIPQEKPPAVDAPAAQIPGSELPPGTGGRERKSTGSEPSDGKPSERGQSLSVPFAARPLRETGMIPQDLENNERQHLPLTLHELRRKIAVAPDRHRWQIRYYSRFVDPIHSLILVLLGVPLILSRGTRNIFFSALLVALISTGYFILNTVLVYLGNRGILGPSLAAWLGPILFASLGMTFYCRMKT